MRIVNHCCVPRCSFKLGIGVQCNLYALPNPVENREWIEKWMQNIGGTPKDIKEVLSEKYPYACKQHYQMLYMRTPRPSYIKQPGETAFDVQNKVEVINTQNVKLAEDHKCSEKSQNKDNVQTETELDEPVVKKSQNKVYVQIKQELKDPLACEEIDDSEFKIISPDEVEWGSNQNNSFHHAVNDVDLTKILSAESKEAQSKPIAQDLLTAGKPFLSTGANTEKEKSTILNFSSGLSTATKKSEETEVQPHKVKILTLKQLVKPSLVKKGKGVVIDLETIKTAEDKESGLHKPFTKKTHDTQSVAVAETEASRVDVIENNEDSDFDISQFSYFEADQSEANVAQVELPEVPAAVGPEVIVPEVEEPEVVLPNVKAVSESKIKAHMLYKVSGEQLIKLKRYLKKKKSTPSCQVSKPASSITRPDHSSSPADHFVTPIEAAKNNAATQRYLHYAIDEAMDCRISSEKAEKIKGILKSCYEQQQESKKVINKLKRQIVLKNKVIAAFKKKLSSERVNSKSKAFEKLTKDMTEDAKLIIRMHVVHHKKTPRARRFSLKEKLFCLALFKLSRQAYRYMSTLLAMPTTITLDKFLNDLHTKLLVKDSNTDGVSQDVKGGPVTDATSNEKINDTSTSPIANQEISGPYTVPQEIISEPSVNILTDVVVHAAMNYDPQENYETAAAVATICDDSARQNTKRSKDTTNNKQIEYPANEIVYSNEQVYTDETYLQSDVISNFNEIVFTNYSEHTNGQTPQILQIPTNYGTIKIGYTQYEKPVSKENVPEKLNKLLERNENISKNCKVNASSNQVVKKSKCIIPTLSDEKRQKIDFILKQMMTPEQLNNLFPKPQKRKKKKTGDDTNKKIKKHKVQKIGTIGITKPDTNVKKDVVSNIVRRKRNFRKITSTLSHHTPTEPKFTDQSHVPGGAKEPLQTSNLSRVVTQSYDNTMYPLGPTRNDRIVQQKCYRNVHKNTPNYVQHARNYIVVKAYETDPTPNTLQIRNDEDSIDPNAIDTVTKLRRNLEKYSPKAGKGNSNVLETSQRTSGQIFNSRDKRSGVGLGKRKYTHMEREPIEVKHQRKLVIDESLADAAGQNYGPDMFVLGTQDGRPTNVAINRNPNALQYQNKPLYITEEPVRDKGFDMPDLSQDFNTSYDSNSRKQFGFKRLPTNIIDRPV